MESFKEWLQENHRRDIANLQANSVITVFHGTSADDAYEFCLNGIDAKKQQRYRIYPHLSGGKPIKFGIFVGPDLKTAQKFGNVILKFSVLGKDLVYRYPTEMNNLHKKSFYKDTYPNSFRPTVSYDMLDRGVEPQAIFIGLLSPRAIQKVFAYDYKGGWNSMTPQEYIEQYSTKNPKTRIYKSPFEPQQYNMTLQDFVKKLAQEHEMTEEEILQTLQDVYRRSGHLTGIGNIPPTLLKRIELQLKQTMPTNQ